MRRRDESVCRVDQQNKKQREGGEAWKVKKGHI